jgi:lipopolysaccharide biosynthesis glycosyltransferase
MPSAVAGGGSIAVCTALDAGYLPLVLVVAHSMAASAAPDSHVVFHVLYDGPDSWVVRRIERWRHPQVDIVLHRLPNPFAPIGTINGFPPSTLFRFVVPRLLAELDRVIYLDVDLIVEADLKALFHAPLDGKPIGAAVDVRMVDEALTSHPHRQATRDGTHGYLRDVLGFASAAEMLGCIQAGVTVLDLNQLRELGYEQRMADTMLRLRDLLRFADQCAINTAFRGQIALLDPRWNVLPEALVDDMWDDLAPELTGVVALQRSEPRIIHFAYRKPWRRWGLPGSDRWWLHARRAGLGPYFAWQFLAARATIELSTLRNKLKRSRKAYG